MPLVLPGRSGGQRAHDAHPDPEFLAAFAPYAEPLAAATLHPPPGEVQGRREGVEGLLAALISGNLCQVRDLDIAFATAGAAARPVVGR